MHGLPCICTAGINKSKVSMGGHHLERTVELTQNEATVGNIASRVCTCSQLALCSAISCNRESYKISVGLRYCAEVRHLNQHTVAEPILRDLLSVLPQRRLWPPAPGPRLSQSVTSHVRDPAMLSCWRDMAGLRSCYSTRQRSEKCQTRLN